MRSSMRQTTYRALQLVASLMSCFSTLALAQSLRDKADSLSGVLLSVGITDWIAVALVSLSFGLVSLLQKFKNSEAVTRYVIFTSAHLGGSFISGVVVYMISESALDSPNRFAQALAIGAAGWGGSRIADIIASKFEKQAESKP